MGMRSSLEPIAATVSSKTATPEPPTYPFIADAAARVQSGRLRTHIARANGPALNHWDAVDMTKLVATLARSSRP